MRKQLLLFLALSLFSLLNAGGFYTLSGIKPTHIFVKNNSNLLGTEEVEEIKKILSEVLKTLGLQPDQRDTATLMVKVDSLSGGGKHYIYIKFAVGEDIVTNRKDRVRSFSLTYDSSDFIQSEEPKSDVIDSVQFLADAFVEHYIEDNE